MTASALTARLEELAADDATLAPLARLQTAALRSLAADPAWRASAARIGLSPRADVPILHGATITLPRETPRALLATLLPGADAVDPLALIEASVAQREVEIEALASVASAEPAALMTVGQLVAWPLLLAVGDRVRSGVEERGWPKGHCPVCAAWPLLSELRGIDRTRVLRCGRCTAAWAVRHGECPYCGNDDHRALRYLSSDEQRESRRVAVCDRCHGHLKAVATLKPLDAEDLAFTDLVTVDLDIAAIDRGYGRPTEPAFALDVTVDAE